LIEIILVVVILVIILGVAIPHFVSATRSARIRSSTRMISRMSRYTRSMAITREQTMCLVFDLNTMSIIMGPEAQTVSTNTADGEIDQDVLKRLGYVKEDSDSAASSIQKEMERKLPEGIKMVNFEKKESENEALGRSTTIRYFSDGESESFSLKLQDERGLGAELESDPITAKVHSKLLN
jgi:hypothetical protein